MKKCSIHHSPEGIIQLKIFSNSMSELIYEKRLTRPNITSDLEPQNPLIY